MFQTNGNEVLDLLGGPKVCQFDVSHAVNQDVGPFDIPVHYFVVMQVLHAKQDLPSIDLDD